MTRVNENYLKLPGSYLFSTIGKKRKAYAEAHPDSNIICLLYTSNVVESVGYE